MPRWARIFSRFSQLTIGIFVRRKPGTPHQNAPKFGHCRDCLISMPRLLAPLLLHSPVNELHSIEIKAHTNLFFLLTQKIEGVKHNCSLTVSEVFPVGAASGGQAKSPSA
jgi:hypothetical protein